MTFDISGINDSHSIAIHKVQDDMVELAYGESKTVKMVIFPRRSGYHSLKGFKIIDKMLEGDIEHRKKGYTYIYPRFMIN